MQICRFSNLKSFTAKLFLTFAALTSTQQLFAQMIDDFSDGDFSTNPTWAGTNEKFVVMSQELTLQAPASTGAGYLTTETGPLTYENWEFLVRMDFNPSSTNYSRVYVCSDQPNLSGPLNGYFVLIGGASDELSLWKQAGATFTKIIEGRPGLLDLNSFAVKIRVAFDETGGWTLYSDIGASGSFFNEGSAIDITHTPLPYFGIYCRYTSSRSDKFYFDDFSVGNLLVKDTSPPKIKSLDVLSSTQLGVTFSEPVDQQTAMEISNYMVDNGHGGPSQVTLESDRSVLLLFQQAFVSGLSYSLLISGIQDIAGNIISSSVNNFTFFEIISASPKDIIITEIYADPSPTVGLPEFEFVEIFNRSKNTFDLEGWTITDGSSTSTLSQFIIHPGEYLILTSDSSAFIRYGQAMEVSGFPSLNNSGDIIVVKDINDHVIDSVNYSDNWYKNNESKEGGWTLELIDPENLCSESENWIASEDGSGGTPGKQNSVFSNKPDLTGPFLVSAIPIVSSLIQLSFNEKLEATLPLPADFTLAPFIEVKGVSFSDASLKNLSLSLSNAIDPEVTYSITANRVYDCSGNPISGNANQVDFGLPQLASPGDILINEILFNPRPLGNDFVEIVNASSKFINLKNWSIANLLDGMPVNAQTIVAEDFLFKPGGYLLLTDDVNAVASEYPAIRIENALVVNDLPTFNDDAGSVSVIDETQHAIEGFVYTDNLHSIFLDDTEGVSLERISFTRPAAENQNWKSASSSVGFATPGFLNSNGLNDATLSDETIKVVPETFMPVNGQPNFAQILYNFEKGGYVANVNIYDPTGHLIKHVVTNELLGTEGLLRWDGDRDDGQKARVGYYMICFEIYDETGMVKTFRNRIVVAAKF